MFRYLLSWLSRLFGVNSLDTYRPADRLIYHYWDGQRWIGADPIQLYKRMMARGPELAVDIKVANSISKDAGTAHDAKVKKIREIFNLKPLEEGGLTEVETVELLNHFWTFCDSVKKNSRTQPIPSPTTEVSSNSGKESPPISNSSDSGSTANVSSTDVPEKSGSDAVSPSASSIPEENSLKP